jgi:hypothetical protein
VFAFCEKKTNGDISLSFLRFIPSDRPTDSSPSSSSSSIAFYVFFFFFRDFKSGQQEEDGGEERNIKKGKSIVNGKHRLFFFGGLCPSHGDFYDPFRDRPPPELESSLRNHFASFFDAASSKLRQKPLQLPVKNRLASADKTCSPNAKDF